MKIILTGNASGQAVLNHFLIPEIIKKGWGCMYIGPRSGSANTIVKEEEQGPARYAGYAAISAGNLSPHFSLSNLVESGRIVLGVIQACEQKTGMPFQPG